MRLDRLIAKHTNRGKKTVRQFLDDRRVRVNGHLITNGQHPVSKFCQVTLDDQILQSRTAYYYMLNKPQGYLSANKDPQHPTVLELIDLPDDEELHIAGRLDRSTTGLLLLTNDGNWSRRITEPRFKKPKTYLVETEDPISSEYTELFAQGVHLMPEDIVTHPAELEILAERTARLTIYEGRYHQVKRMFYRFQNKLTSLHRERMSEIHLDPKLAPGEYRPLTPEEIASV